LSKSIRNIFCIWCN